MSELIRVERYITYFNKGDHLELGEINVDVIPFEILLTIIKAKDDDPLLYDQYPLDEHVPAPYKLDSFLKIV
jgi:hypothetical protein